MKEVFAKSFTVIFSVDQQTDCILFRDAAGALHKCDYLSDITSEPLDTNVRYSHYVSMGLREYRYTREHENSFVGK